MTTFSSQATRSLRNLYFTRTAFQLLWAGAVLSTALRQPRLAAVLLVVYPLWDVACTLYDLRASHLAGSARTSQRVNAVLGTAAAVGMGLTVFTRPGLGIAIFGAWALGAGLLQLVAGLIRRRALGGQWAMILSGLQSTAAGAAFVVGGLGGKLHAKDMGGYAIFGAAYFLIGGLLLARKLSRSSAAAEGNGAVAA